MRARWVVVWLVGLMVMPVLAQRQAGGDQPARPGAQPARGPASPLEMATQLAETLQLTPEQKTKYTAIVDKYKPKWESQAADREKTMELMRQMREARQDGDEAKTEQIRKQIDEMREKSRSTTTQFLAEVEPILTPEQVVKLNAFREQQDRGRGMPGAGGIEQLIQRLPTDLKLTDDQKKKYEELAAKFQQQQQESRRLTQEMRQARQAGDGARVIELEKQIRERNNESGVDAFLAKVESILTDAQKAELPDLWLRFGGMGGAGDARAVLQAARRLTLSEEQQTKLKDIIHKTMLASRGADTPEKHTELVTTTKNAVLALLDAKQKEEFERLLQRPARPMRGGRGGPGEGGGENP